MLWADNIRLFDMAQYYIQYTMTYAYHIWYIQPAKDPIFHVNGPAMGDCFDCLNGIGNIEGNHHRKHTSVAYTRLLGPISQKSS